MTEREETYLLADRLLDVPNADPDDELRMLSRQLLAHRDRAEFGVEALATQIVCVNLVGFLDTGPGEPMERSNCFTVLVEGKEVRIVNFGAENLEKLIAKGLTFPIRLLKFGCVAVIHDARIGERWYNQHWCEVCCPKELLPLPQQHRQQREIAIGKRKEDARCVSIDTSIMCQFE